MRTTCRRLAAGLAPLLLLALSATPADAHGALSAPASRAAACAPDGGSARSAACRAAAAAGDDAAAWDDIRVPDVNGRDRQVIPDGHLCSGNLDRFRGLDLARPDWPSTRLTPGATITFRYRASIPHQGSFRFYLTRPGWSRSTPLGWGDLAAKPFLTVTDPPLKNGAYQIRGKLPADRTGAHLIYTIWQTSSTPDTYYSCSDVVFSGANAAAGATAKRKPAAKPRPTATAKSPAADTAGLGSAEPAEPAAGEPTATPGGLGALEPASDSRPTGGIPGGTLGLMAAVSVGAVLTATLLVLGARRRRTRP
ncbi:lytic polysaccharide monooxygenase [Plantactinospora siamensis]|uniref:Lytic polysaccharide monooxygenase n=1 Tax=Plantactinospora siamensis TaxID=555372 RepID=A0ABV6NRJ8_9ACTN